MPDVCIWRLRLGEGSDSQPSWDALDARERARALGLRSPANRERYVQGRGGLRRILSSYRGEPARAIALLETATGKPTTEGVEFNVSHAREDFVCAVTRTVPVGIDIEHLAQLPDLDALLFVCSRAESDRLRAQPEPERSALFLRFWTRKEAVLKAAGCGLGSMPLHEVDVTEDLVRIGPDRWTLTNIPLDGVICSLATRGTHSPAIDVIGSEEAQARLSLFS